MRPSSAWHRSHFCGSGALLLEVVDEVLYQVVQIGGDSLEAAVRACANIVPLDLGPKLAPLLFTPEPPPSPPRANGAAAAHSKQNSAEQLSAASKRQNGSAAAVVSAEPEQKHTELDLGGDEAYSNPLHRKIRDKVASGRCTERELTALAEQIKGREGFTKLKKALKRAIKDAKTNAPVQIPVAVPPFSGAPAPDSVAKARGKQYFMAYHNLKPDAYMDIKHEICGWFIGKNGTRLKELQVSLTILHPGHVCV